MIILNQAVIIMISRSTQERSRLPRRPPSLSQGRRTEQTLVYATLKAVIVNCHHCSHCHHHLFSLFLWFWNHTFSRKKEFFSLGTEGRQKYILFLKSSANYPFQIVRLFWSLIASHSCFGQLHKMQRAPADWLEIVNISYFPPPSFSTFFHRFTSARLPWFSFSMFYRAKQHHQPERSGKKRGAICWKYLLWQSFVTSPVVGKTRRNFSPAGQQPARHLHLADEPPMFLCLVNRKRICPNIWNLFSHQWVSSEPDIFVWPSTESTLA